MSPLSLPYPTPPSVLIANIKGCEFHWTLGPSWTSWLVRNLTQGPWILPDPRIPVHTPSLHPHQQTSMVSHLWRPEVSWRQHLKASASSQEIIFQYLSPSKPPSHRQKRLIPLDAAHLIRFTGAKVFFRQEPVQCPCLPEQENAATLFAALGPTHAYRRGRGFSTESLILEKRLLRGSSNPKLCPESRGVKSGATNQGCDWSKNPGTQVRPQFPHLQNGITRPSPRIVVGIKGDNFCTVL